MHISDETRKHLLIAGNMEELLAFTHAARLGNQTGFPVILIPFGAPEEEGEVIRSDSQLMNIGPEMLRFGAYGYVHVIKLTRHPGS